jgi:hypothetical protein
VVHVPEDTAAMLLLNHAKVTEEATILANPAPVETVASFTNTSSICEADPIFLEINGI